MASNLTRNPTKYVHQQRVRDPSGCLLLVFRYTQQSCRRYMCRVRVGVDIRAYRSESDDGN
jgi:hypothetical protein